MNYTSYEVSKKLWEAGFVVLPASSKIRMVSERNFFTTANEMDNVAALAGGDGCFPCYDLGTLIDELCKKPGMFSLFPPIPNTPGFDKWTANWSMNHPVEGETKEDATANLLIDLMK